jgi:Rieske Fe-S protein
MSRFSLQSRTPEENRHQSNQSPYDPESGLPRRTFLKQVAGVASFVAMGGLGTSAAMVLDPLKSYAAATKARIAASGPGVWLGNVKNMRRNSSLAYTDPASGDPAVLVRLQDGRFVSFDTVCTHAGCTVPYDPARKLLICPCHGATFDPTRNATVVSGPAPSPLTKLPIRLDSKGNVYALDSKPKGAQSGPKLRKPPAPGSGGENEKGDNEGSRGKARRHGSRKSGHDD